RGLFVLQTLAFVFQTGHTSPRDWRQPCIGRPCAAGRKELAMTTWGALGGGLAATFIFLAYLEWRSRHRAGLRPGRRRLRAAALSFCAALGLVNVAAGSAWAVSSSQATAWTYQGQYMCTRSHVYINSAGAQPHLDAYGAALHTDIYNGVWYGCNDN